MYCDKCGSETRTGAKFFHSCGAELKNETRSENAHTRNHFAIGNTENEVQKKSLAVPNKLEAQKDHIKEFLGGIHHPWRRFFARTVDLSSLGLLILFLFSFLFGYLFPQNVDGLVKALGNPLTAGIILYILWLPVEAAFLAVAGTTPGKWIFGISVLSNTGDKLSYSNALKRASLVWIGGDALGIPIVALFTRLIAYRALTKTGTTFWDSSVGSVVTHKSWGVIRAFTCVLTVLIVLIIIGFLNSMFNK